MQRIYIFILIAAIIFAVSYSDTIKSFFSSTGSREQASPVRQESADQDDSYEQLRIDLYRTATRLSDLQGKIQILQMAKEKQEWFSSEDYAHLDALIEETKKELEAAEGAYEKTKEEFTRITVQMMLKTFSEQQ